MGLFRKTVLRAVFEQKIDRSKMFWNGCYGNILFNTCAEKRFLLQICRKEKKKAWNRQKAMDNSGIVQKKRFYEPYLSEK